MDAISFGDRFMEMNTAEAGQLANYLDAKREEAERDNDELTKQIHELQKDVEQGRLVVRQLRDIAAAIRALFEVPPRSERPPDGVQDTTIPF